MTHKQRYTCYSTLYFLGILLMFFQIHAYRNTLINWLIPTSLVLGVTIFVLIIDFKNFKRTYICSGNEWFMTLMHYIIGFGFTVSSVFMLTNYYLADQKSNIENYKIVDRTRIEGSGPTYNYGREQVVFTINYHGKEKELIFSSDKNDNFDFYRTVEIETQKGFLGFDILRSKKLQYEPSVLIYGTNDID